MSLRFPRNKNSGLGTSRYREEEETIIEGRVNGGIVTTIDPVDLKNSQFEEVQNFTVRNDKTSRKLGRTVYAPANPDSNKILYLAGYKNYAGDLVLVRFTNLDIHISDGALWTPVVGVLSGGESDRFNVVTANNRLFSSNNGADPIQEVNVAAFTHAQLGNAPAYRYITSFNNRILGANLVDAVTPDPDEVGWSGNLNFVQWDALVDKSAGKVSLVDAPSDAADPITGLFGFTEVALMLRERSLWSIGKQPIATNPYVFNCIFPGLGCDTPFSAVSIKNGICWFDYRTAQVYVYKVGMEKPEVLSESLNTSIMDSVVQPGVSKNSVFGSYDPIEDEYSLVITDEDAFDVVVHTWVYNFRTQAWYLDRDEGTDGAISAMATIEHQDAPFDPLLHKKFYATSDGHIFYDDPASFSRSGDSILTSKTYKLTRYDSYIQSIKFEIHQISGIGLPVLSYSKDGGTTWTIWKFFQFDPANAGKRISLKAIKHIKCKSFKWKINCADGIFDILDYEIAFISSTGQTKPPTVG